MNSEKKLYDLIKNNYGFLAMRDEEVAEQLNVKRGNIPVYKRKLRDAGYIETKVKYVDGKPMTLYKIKKEYTGMVEW